MDPFAGRVAVITGGAGGIGMALARAFAARGA
jgi:NAD(P)-dependent dehydrogenase (short-subunit alcohol dehydrogenase family)